MKAMQYNLYESPRVDIFDLGPDSVLCESQGGAGALIEYNWEQE